jgi:hypothetical protein
VVETRTEPAGAGLCWTRCNINSLKTKPLLTLPVSAPSRVLCLHGHSDIAFGASLLIKACLRRFFIKSQYEELVEI